MAPNRFEGNLALMEKLLRCGTNVYLWEYATDGHLVRTNTEDLVLDQFFTNSGCKDYMLQCIGKYTAPVILGGPMGLMWAAVFDKEFPVIYVIGPVIHSENSNSSWERYVLHYDIDRTWRQGFLKLMRSLPVVSSILFYQYALMLHCCVTGEQLTRSDLHFQKSNRTDRSEPAEQQGDRSNVWMTEQALLGMVREGNMNYQDVISRASLMSGGIQSGDSSAVLSALVSCTGFTSLCVREAIQAGISPGTAYRVGDSYIQSMVQCNTLPELRALNHAMLEDFIMRVHKHRTNPNVSVLIQNCRDYIESHTGQPLTLKLLADKMGYSEYHLSRKFKKEMGVPISYYIKVARVEQAKLMLIHSNDSVSKIAMDLQFCSSSHFAEVFQEITGKKPHQYRSEQQMKHPRKKSAAE